MLRLSFKLCGYLMLLGAMLSVVVAARGFGGSTDLGPTAGSHVSEHIRNAGFMAAIWLLCVAAVPILDFFTMRPDAEHDPYEAHPKMSPSVQPTYEAYSDIEP